MRRSISYFFGSTSTRRFTDAAKPPIRGTLPQYGKGVEVGQYAEIERIFTVEDVARFGDLVGDKNPLHACMTRDDASDFPTLQHAGLIKIQDDKSEALVHGMLASSLFSCIFGTLIPGAVYRSQDLQFRAPIYANDLVVGRIQVKQVKIARGLLVSCDTSVTCKERTCVSGEATVWLPEGTKLK